MDLIYAIDCIGLVAYSLIITAAHIFVFFFFFIPTNALRQCTQSLALYVPIERLENVDSSAYSVQCITWLYVQFNWVHYAIMCDAITHSIEQYHMFAMRAILRMEFQSTTKPTTKMRINNKCKIKWNEIEEGDRSGFCQPRACAHTLTHTCIPKRISPIQSIK